MEPRAGGAASKHKRLVHVDAMRPVKQAGVVTTHALLFFAPAAGAAVGASLLLTHVTRFAFMFISAAMLVYAYPNLEDRGIGVFWRRRLLAVALPYVTWTVIYFAFESLPIGGIPAAFRPTGGIVASVPVTLEHLGTLLASGYYQLYYLVILLELYLVYPAFLWLLRTTEHHHVRLLATSVAVELALVSLLHWGLLPAWMSGNEASRELWNYQLYIVAGGIMAWHYQAVHRWLCSHRKLVLGAAAASLALAEVWFVLAQERLVPGLGGQDASGPFQPVVIPLFLAVIAALYLLGVSMSSSRLPARVRSWVHSGAENSYGVYLSQVLFISILAAAGWGTLDRIVPWPLVVGGAVLIVSASALALTAVLARLPGARATAGRARQPWPNRAVEPRIRCRPSTSHSWETSQVETPQ